MRVIVGMGDRRRAGGGFVNHGRGGLNGWSPVGVVSEELEAQLRRHEIVTLLSMLSPHQALGDRLFGCTMLVQRMDCKDYIVDGGALPRLRNLLHAVQAHPRMSKHAEFVREALVIFGCSRDAMELCCI